MKRAKKFVFLTFASLLLVAGCDSFQANKTISLSDGRLVDVTIDKDTDPKTLIAKVASKQGSTTKRSIDKDAYLVWNEIKQVADEFEIDEGLLNYRVVGVDGKERQFLYTAEKIETGEWLVRSAQQE